MGVYALRSPKEMLFNRHRVPRTEQNLLGAGRWRAEHGWGERRNPPGDICLNTKRGPFGGESREREPVSDLAWKSSVCGLRLAAPSGKHPAFLINRLSSFGIS